MGVSKVEVGGETKLDLTNDTVTPETLMEGYTAHGADGEPIVGTAKGGGSGSAMDPYLGETVSVDINNATGVIVSTMEEGTVTTSFSKGNNGEDVITSNITMNSGDYDYVRRTTITKVGSVDQVRTTLIKNHK